MDYYGSGISKLIESLSSLPGIGRKSAQRLAFHIIAMPKEQVKAIADSLVEAREKVHFCSSCCTITDSEICPICASSKRNHRQIMIVENSRDLAAYEKTGRYEGVYHVLHGSISPMLGVGPNDIRLKELLMRLQDENGDAKVDEIIIATGSSVEGESTAMYIVKLVKTLGLPIRLTRIATGVPVGGDIENIDEVTLERALSGRTEV
ncbi:MAG: recombination mediator RecR [Eubacteriales bacterium]|nr:recombination mediator RecR [Eubacteriales bacterium]